MGSGQVENKPPHPNFDQQFAKFEQIQKPTGETINVYDIRPEKPKDDVPVFIAQGWCGTAKSYKNLLRATYEDNRRVMTVDHPRLGNGRVVIEELAKYPQAELRKMQSMIEAMNLKGVGRIDTIAYSEGAIYTLIAATLRPERFRNIVLVDPGGLTGKDKWYGLLKKLLTQPKEKNEKGEIEPKPPGFDIEGIMNFIKSPSRAIEELSAIGESDITEMIRNLHSKGIGISIVHGVEDKVFPVEEVTKSLNHTPLDIDGFYSVKGGHDKLMTNPNYMQLALNALDNLQAKKSKPENN